MPRLTGTITGGNSRQTYDEFERVVTVRLQRASLEAADKASRNALRTLRGDMAGAGLGRLGNAMDQASDLQGGRGVHDRGGGAWSASGGVFIRTRSPRSRGAIEAYTQGASIQPARGRWLWIATTAIPSKAGRERMTPESYVRNGFTRKIGPLIPLKSVNGYPLLAIENVGVSLAGKPRSAKSLTKTGNARKGQAKRDLVIAFYAIPATSRAARVDAVSVMVRAQSELQPLMNRAIGRTK